ncbi:MAG: cell division protein FtsA [Candidatus Sungbacteria bacterium]|uniref:Cell division protein FtsA n=1 Tax=Candidatus Sungiibacteriota bacterium TaxID=2750080 RepID=A0A932YXF9_9BACT|nr:cell division protein FtsA [Candidatus Sungbacteria bacterium]
MRAAVGIDIGTTNTTTVVVRRDKSGKFRITGFGQSPSAGMRRGAIFDVEAAAGALKRSLHEASRTSGERIRSALVSVGGAHLAAFAVRGAVAVSRADGEITEDDVRRAIHTAEGMAPKNPNREVIHVIPRGYRVDGDGSIADPVGMVGMKLESDALVVDGSKPALANLIKCCELAGIEVEDWAASTLAASEVLLTKRQKELGVMLLDLGAGTSDFAIFEEGRILDVGSFPFGGAHITNDIAVGLKAQVTVAEAIKIRYASVAAEMRARRENIRLADFHVAGGEEFPLRELTDIIGARLTDIFELSFKALKRIGRAGLLPGGVVLTGGVADIPGIQDLCRRELKLPVEVAKAGTPEVFADVVPARLAIPVGLMLWQWEQTGFRGRHRSWGIVERAKHILRGFVP